MISAGKPMREGPPGMTAFSLRPFHTPPHSSIRSLKGIPIGNSRLPGFSTWPETEKITVPPEFTGPNPANQAAPLRMMVGTEAKLCALLMVVGVPNKPKLAGNGGWKRGLPGLPSRDPRSAASSPQVDAPAPKKGCRSAATAEPRLEAGLAGFARERLEQRGFLAADVRAGADEGVQIEVHAGPQDILAQETRRIGFRQGRLESRDRLGQKFAANVVVAHRRGHRVAAYGHCFDHRERVVAQDKADKASDSRRH